MQHLIHGRRRSRDAHGEIRHLLIVLFTLASAWFLVGGPLPAHAEGVPITVDGVLFTLIHDGDMDAENPSWTGYGLQEVDTGGTPTGNIYFMGQATMFVDVVPGTTIQVEGTLQDENFLIPSSYTELKPPPHGPYCQLGDHSMIVIVSNWLDKSAPCTTADVQSTVFTDPASVKAYYAEDSLGQHNLYGDVAGVFTINYKSTQKCNLGKLTRMADQAAVDAGWDVSAYMHRFYVFPAGSGDCAAGGGAYRSIKLPTKAFAFGACDDHVFAHEYGHNLGMGHAGVEGDEYGDRSDTMGPAIGAGKLRHNNAAFKYSTCFVPSQSVVDVSSSGTHTLGMLEADTGASEQVLRAFKQGGSTPVDWYFAFRTAYGFDANLPSEHVNKTNMHIYSTNNYLKGWMPDALLWGWVADGDQFREYDNNFTLTQTAHTTENATVQMIFGLPDADTTEPTVPPNLGADAPKKWVYLTWGASTDNMRLAGYKVYRNNTQIGSTPYRKFVDRNTQSGRTYSYYVTAFDDAGNESPPSNVVAVQVN